MDGWGFSAKWQLYATLFKKLIWENPKPPYDSEEVPKSNKVVGGSIPSHEIVSLLDKKLVKQSKRLMCSKKTKTKTK